MKSCRRSVDQIVAVLAGYGADLSGRVIRRLPSGFSLRAGLVKASHDLLDCSSRISESFRILRVVPVH